MVKDNIIAPYYMMVYNSGDEPIFIPEQVDAFGRPYKLLTFNEFQPYPKRKVVKDRTGRLGHYVTYKRCQDGFLKADDSWTGRMSSVNPMYVTTMMVYTSLPQLYNDIQIDRVLVEKLLTGKCQLVVSLSFLYISIEYIGNRNYKLTFSILGTVKCCRSKYAKAET